MAGAWALLLLLAIFAINPVGDLAEKWPMCFDALKYQHGRWVLIYLQFISMHISIYINLYQFIMKYGDVRSTVCLWFMLVCIYSLSLYVTPSNDHLQIWKCHKKKNRVPPKIIHFWGDFPLTTIQLWGMSHNSRAPRSWCAGWANVAMAAPSEMFHGLYPLVN